jgi:hypothetical protein
VEVPIFIRVTELARLSGASKASIWGLSYIFDNEFSDIWHGVDIFTYTSTGAHQQATAISIFHR